MKKVIHNIYTKIILALMAVLLTGSALYQTFNMLERYAKYCEDMREADDWSTVWDQTPEEICQNHVESIFLDMLSLYVNVGIDGVIELVEGWENEEYYEIEADYCYILIATKDKIYSNFANVNELQISDKMGYVDDYNMGQVDSEYYDPAYDWYSDVSNEYTIYFNSAKKVVYDAFAKEEILDGHEEVESNISRVKEPFSMRIYLKNQYFEDKYYWYVSDYNWRFEQITQIYEKDMGEMLSWVVVEVVCLAIMLILLGVGVGKKVDGITTLNKWDRKPLEFHLFTILLVCVPVVGLIAYLYDRMGVYSLNEYWRNAFKNQYVRWAYIIFGTIIVLAVVYELGVLIKKRKRKSILKDSIVAQLVNRFCKWIKTVYNSSAYAALPRIKKVYVRKVVMDVIAAITTVVIITQINSPTQQLHNAEGKIFTIIVVVCYFVNSFIEYKNLRKYNQVCKAIETIYHGDYKSFKVDENEKNEALKMIANLSDSFEESVRKQVEAEKLQVELVANVSHDLKTPLTSIISYVELLKDEEMSDVAKDYVKVLSVKSDRLKDIVADVFDLAKATSGEEVPMEQLDGVVLINQVLSDMQDKIEGSGREIRTKITPEAAPLTGNGQKLYRVFQNIIDNALKYSMPGTRIYLNADLVGAEFVVVLKNVSEYEMEFTAEQVMSRFTRGDKSRHSEGNGLGLSIAKSFTELMGGTFTVEIDDDVFKTIVRLRL